MEQHVWEALYTQAQTKKAQDLNERFSVCADEDDSLLSLAWANCRREEPWRSKYVERAAWGANEPSAAVRNVYLAAVHMGLIAPGVLGQRLDWGADRGVYQFTAAGLDFFGRGMVSLSNPGLLTARVQETVQVNALDPGIVPLVAEAQRCWMTACHRAAMILVGLSAEGACIGLLDCFASYPLPPKPATPMHNAWSQATDGSRVFYARWRPGLDLLIQLKSELRKAYGAGRPDWWPLWESVPTGIAPFGEAVRLGRNVAAHSIENVFTPAQVGLLLASLPTLLEVIAQLTAFLQKPPTGVSLPAL